MAMAMAGKHKNSMFARTKAHGRLLFWVVCVCHMGVLYGHMGTIQPQTANMAAYWPAWSRGWSKSDLWLVEFRFRFRFRFQINKLATFPSPPFFLFFSSATATCFVPLALALAFALCTWCSVCRCSEQCVVVVVVVVDWWCSVQLLLLWIMDYGLWIVNCASC